MPRICAHLGHVDVFVVASLALCGRRRKDWLRAIANQALNRQANLSRKHFGDCLIYLSNRAWQITAHHAFDVSGSFSSRHRTAGDLFAKCRSCLENSRNRRNEVIVDLAELVEPKCRKLNLNPRLFFGTASGQDDVESRNTICGNEETGVARSKDFTDLAAAEPLIPEDRFED